MVGILVSFWEGPFSGAMLVLGRVKTLQGGSLLAVPCLKKRSDYMGPHFGDFDDFLAPLNGDFSLLQVEFYNCCPAPPCLS